MLSELFPQLVRAGELSPSQVRAGLSRLRGIIAANGRPPLIWTRADGYQPGAERAVVREKLTESRRFITGTGTGTGTVAVAVAG